MKWRRPLAQLGLCLTLLLAASGCTVNTANDILAEPPVINPISHMSLDLEGLPAGSRLVDISVYEFPDLTGQQKPNDKYADYSKAVTQGGALFLIDALKRTAKGKWFRVVQRSDLKNLLQERQIIDVTRGQTQGKNASHLPALLFAGVLLEGGIIAYETDTLTGGAGATLLGIGGNAMYRRDQVTIGLTLTAVQTGEILETVTTTKTIYSVGLSGIAYHYVSLDHLLDAEAGITRNEPPQLAVREAIESGVYALIMQGALDDLWSFADPAAGSAALRTYLDRKNRPIDPAEVAIAMGGGTGAGSELTQPTASQATSASGGEPKIVESPADVAPPADGSGAKQKLQRAATPKGSAKPHPHGSGGKGYTPGDIPTPAVPPLPASMNSPTLQEQTAILLSK